MGSRRVSNYSQKGRVSIHSALVSTSGSVRGEALMGVLKKSVLKVSRAHSFAKGMDQEAVSRIHCKVYLFLVLTKSLILELFIIFHCMPCFDMNNKSLLC